MFEFNTTIALELGVVICFGVIPGLLSQFAVKKPEVDKFKPHWITGLWLNIFHELAIILLILFISMKQSGGLDAVGLEVYSTDHPFEQIVGAVFLIGIVALICTMLRELFGLKKPGEDNERPDWAGALYCKTVPAKILFLAYMLSAVVAEEMVFRGYFILLWGRRTGHIVPCAIISAVLFSFLHLYQGRKNILDHILFPVAFSVTAAVSGNIVITIYMHLWLNLIVTAKLWYREYKEKKSSATDAQAGPESSSGSLAFWLSACSISLAVFGVIELYFESQTFLFLAFVLGIVAFAQAGKEQKAARRLAIVALVVSSIPIFVAVVLPMLMIAAVFIMILLLGIFG